MGMACNAISCWWRINYSIGRAVLVNQWFKQRSGLALGIITAAGGLIGAFTQPLIGNLIATQGWRSAYIIVAVAAIIIIVPTIMLFLRKSPQEKGLLPYGAVDNNNVEKKVETNIAIREFRLRMLKNRCHFHC
ncbi:hypothetical protein LSPH24S_03530 [Lysinibacillus sphaericus]